jgi:hypothetical protein
MAAHCGVIPKQTVPELLPLGESLRLPKQSMMNSSLPN